jgi:actin-related protein
MRKDVDANVMLSGWTTMFRGLPERIEKDEVALTQLSMKATVIATPGKKKNSVWLGIPTGEHRYWRRSTLCVYRPDRIPG